MAALRRGLQELNWIENRSVAIISRFFAGDRTRARAQAAELVTLAPDVLLGNGTPALIALREVTDTLPIVFLSVVDPVGAGFVQSMSHPGGNITGFTPFEYALGGKWLELLKDVGPRISRVAVLRDPTLPGGPALFGVIQAVASSFRVQVTPVGVQNAAEIERAITGFANKTDGGLIVLPSAAAAVHRTLIIALAAKHRLPAVYPYRYFVADGGLVSYGLDLDDQMRRAGGYVGRILRGEKPTDLPVQAPTKYELVINLKTAKALGLTVPDTLLARADEVIE